MADIIYSWFHKDMTPDVILLNVINSVAKAFVTLLKILFELVCILLKMLFGVSFTLLNFDFV